jgi:hypothetical protein
VFREGPVRCPSTSSSQQPTRRFTTPASELLFASTTSESLLEHEGSVNAADACEILVAFRFSRRNSSWSSIFPTPMGPETGRTLEIGL